MNKVNEFKSISYIKGTFPWQWKPDRECAFCWSFDSDIIAQSKQSDAAEKRDLMKTSSYIIYVKIILIAM